MLFDKFAKKKILVTHDGKFHADDIMATAVLNLVYKGCIKLIRQDRENFDYAHADIVFDVGFKYDPEKNLFDHHQAGGAGARPDGTPYAAFGLIWKHFGLQLVSPAVHTAIDEEIVRLIDVEDVAYDSFYSPKLRSNALSPDCVFGTFIPIDLNPEETYKQFMYLVGFATEYLRVIITKYTKKVADWEKVEKIYNETIDKRVILIDGHGSWQRVLIAKPEPLFVIYPDVNPQNSNYKVQAVPKEIGKFDLRVNPPMSWLGKKDHDLEIASEVVGAKFCHNSGFIMVADSLKSARSMVDTILNG